MTKKLQRSGEMKKASLRGTANNNNATGLSGLATQTFFFCLLFSGIIIDICPTDRLLGRKSTVRWSEQGSKVPRHCSKNGQNVYRSLSRWSLIVIKSEQNRIELRTRPVVYLQQATHLRPEKVWASMELLPTSVSWYQQSRLIESWAKLRPWD